jgi:hypothetical protein
MGSGVRLSILQFFSKLLAHMNLAEKRVVSDLKRQAAILHRLWHRQGYEKMSIQTLSVGQNTPCSRHITLTA